jgi:hypothetical protein
VAELGQDAVPERGIGLAPNPHGDLVLLEVPARLDNVDAHNLRERPEMPLPQLQGFWSPQPISRNTIGRST